MPARMAREGSSGVEASLAIDKLAGFLVEIDEIRKRPAGIDRDAVTSHALTNFHTREMSARYKDMAHCLRQRTMSEVGLPRSQRGNMQPERGITWEGSIG